MLAAFVLSSLISSILIANLGGATDEQRQLMFNMSVWNCIITIPLYLLLSWFVKGHDELMFAATLAVAIPICVVYFRKSSPVDWYGHMIKLLRK